MRYLTIIALILFLVLIFSSCAPHTEIYDSSGNKVHLVECGGLMLLSDCYKRANSICKSGYTVIDQSETSHGSMGFSITEGHQNVGHLGQHISRHIVFSCNDSLRNIG
jgi:hypothetical protein